MTKPKSATAERRPARKQRLHPASENAPEPAKRSVTPNQFANIIAEGVGVQRRPDRDAVLEAAQRVFSRPEPFMVEFERDVDGNVRQIPSDGMKTSHHLVRELDALGTASTDFAQQAIGTLDHMSRPRGAFPGDAAATNAALAFVQAIAPENELESALAIQMAGCHFAAVEMLGRARHAESTPHLQLYGNLATKLQRTFVAQVEALARLRGKGQQTVRVEHVNVAPGAQAIVGDVHHYRGAGGPPPLSGDQPHGASAAAESPALLGQDPQGNGVPVTSHAERPLSHSWREEPGCAEGEQKRA